MRWYALLQILAPLQLSESDLKEKRGAEFIIERNGRRLCNIYVYLPPRHGAPASTDYTDTPLTVLVPDFELEDDPKSAPSLHPTIELVMTLHLLLIQKNPASRLVNWLKAADVMGRGGITATLVSTAALGVEMMRRGGGVTAAVVRRHLGKGLGCRPPLSSKDPSWDLCLCDPEQRTLCGSVLFHYCDTHTLLCHYYISGRPLPPLKSALFIVPVGGKGDKRVLARTYSQACM